MPLLSVENLHVHFRTAGGRLHALRGVTFTVEAGESLGVVGESGCGKTTMARAILRILPPNGEVSEGRVLLHGRDLLALDKEAMRKVRWRAISLVAQSAMNALDPVMRVGEQIIEAIRTHEGTDRQAPRARSAELFNAVGLQETWLRRYPHEFSGGMRQRAMIAMALALNPDLIIADEPTTALDVVMQDQIYQEIEKIRGDKQKALILITHDISLVAENCDAIAVMYAGRIVESGPAATVLSAPVHPYTIGLCSAFPDIRGEERELISIPGTPPDLTMPPLGCSFAPRCPFARERCKTEAPSLEPAAEGQLAACHYREEAAEFRARGAIEKTWDRAATALVEAAR